MLSTLRNPGSSLVLITDLTISNTIDPYYSRIPYLRIHLLAKIYLQPPNKTILGHAQSGKNLRFQLKDKTTLCLLVLAFLL